MKNFRGCEFRHRNDERFARVIWAGHHVHIFSSGVTLPRHETHRLASRHKAEAVFDDSCQSYAKGKGYDLAYLSSRLRVPRSALADPTTALNAAWADDITELLSDHQPAPRSWVIVTGLLSHADVDPAAAATLAYLTAHPHYKDLDADTIIAQTGRSAIGPVRQDRGSPPLRTLLGITGNIVTLCPITPCTTASHTGRCSACDARLAELIDFQLRGRDPKALSTSELARIGDTARRLVHL